MPVHLDFDALLNEIRQFLPDANPEQQTRFAEQVQRLQKLQAFLEQHPEDAARVKQKLEYAEKQLSYKKPYRIAVIGVTGAGKSTMNNAMLGRSLVLMKDRGGPATGTALNIFLDVPKEGRETAVVDYRTEENIRKLIYNELIIPYNLDIDVFSTELDKKLARTILTSEPVSLLEENRNDFITLRETLGDLVEQYAQHNGSYLQATFYLDQPTDCEQLRSLTDENSDFNLKGSSTRQIGLIQSVTYHIKPDDATSVQTLKLPKNVCLVDLPGIDGSVLHNMLICEGIQNADAVMLILDSKRLDGLNVRRLIDSIRKHISLKDSADSSDRIFLVANGRDAIMSDSLRSQDRIPDMYRLIESLIPGYVTRFARRSGKHPYFFTSAWAALQAQRAIRGENIENPVAYGTAKTKLGIENDDNAAVLEASEVPSLVKALMSFAEHRVEGQIRDGRQVLDAIFAALLAAYEAQQQELSQKLGFDPLSDRIEEYLKLKQRDLEKMVKQFRTEILQNALGLANLLDQNARLICNDIDQLLQERLPQLWKEFYVDSEYDPSAISEGGQRVLTILGKTELLLWQQLSLQIPSLGELLATTYQSQWQSQQVSYKVSRFCYDYVLPEEIETKMQEWLGNQMLRKLREVGSRIALTQLSDPQQLFYQEGLDNPLMQSLEQIPRQSELSPDAFHAFVQDVRQHYEPCILRYCIPSLLNLFRYEMLLMEEHLLSDLRSVFSHLRRTDDPALQARVRSDFSNSDDLDRLEQVTTKLAQLTAIQSGSTGDSFQSNGKPDLQLTL